MTTNPTIIMRGDSIDHAVLGVYTDSVEYSDAPEMNQYFVNGQRTTKEKYDEATKVLDTAERNYRCTKI